MRIMLWVLEPCRLVGRCHLQSFSPENSVRIFLPNVGTYRRVYKAPKPRTTLSSIKCVCEQSAEANILKEEEELTRE
jgi:hypothetical protein